MGDGAYCLGISGEECVSGEMSAPGTTSSSSTLTSSWSTDFLAKVATFLDFSSSTALTAIGRTGGGRAPRRNTSVALTRIDDLWSRFPIDQISRSTSTISELGDKIVVNAPQMKDLIEIPQTDSLTVSTSTIQLRPLVARTNMGVSMIDPPSASGPTTPVSAAELIAQFMAQNDGRMPDPTVSSDDPFFHYDRPATFGVRVESVEVPMSDGCLLAGELLRPTTPEDDRLAEGNFPGIVLEFNGYGAASYFGIGARHFVSRGYVVVVCSVRGSGETDGEIEPFGAQEQQDNIDLIEWLAARSFVNGRVGQMGVSYGGHNTILAAANRPPHLAAVIAAQSFSDWYENTIYRGGIPNAQIRDWQQKTAPGTLETYPAHPTYDAFWRERSAKAKWDGLDTPVLDVGGWFDPYRGAMVEMYQANPESVWMIAGPWEHGMVPGQFEDIASAAYLAWFDYWLSDERGELPAARISSFELPAGGWRQFSEWPPHESATVHRKLGAGGMVEETSKADGASYAEYVAPDGQIAFTSAPFENDETIVGEIETRLFVVLSGEDQDFAVILEDVAPDGTSARLTQGWLRASHRDGSVNPKPIDPGICTELRVPLWPLHHRLVAGHSLRIVIASEDFPNIDRVAPEGTVRVELGKNKTELTYRALR